MNSRVSVIVPVYNGELYLAQALESAARQTYKPLEIIVVDDGSTDGSAEAAKSFQGVLSISQLRSGIGGARNRGIQAARGDFYAFLDADDVWLERKLEMQMRAFETNPGLDMVFGQVQEFISPELPAHVKAQLPCETEPKPGVLPSALLIKRASFQRVGLFETNWRVGEFVSWLLRANEEGLEQVILPELVARRRVHSSNNGIRQRGSFDDYARILKASLDRRRTAGQKPHAS